MFTKLSPMIFLLERYYRRLTLLSELGTHSLFTKYLLTVKFLRTLAILCI